MAVAFRIVKRRHEAAAFDGEGASRYGGRWNPKGVRVVYSSATLSLAALEMLVHLDTLATLDLIYFRIEFPAALIESVDTTALPADWNAHPAGPASQAVGAAWIRRGLRPVLRVPSVLVPGEHNYLLNPQHADFAKLRIGGAEDFSFDRRLRKA